MENSFFFNWKTALPPVGDRIFHACLVLVERWRKTLMFLICHKDETAMDTAMMILNRSISHTGIFQNIISGRDAKLYSDLSTNLHKLFCTNVLRSTAFHPQTDGLAERMVQNLEDMIRTFCAYGIEIKYSDGFTHD
ncbi:hypothetical protein O181_023130 [Austropuccinia psidii MF-1]|uniref:Integrase catalytic domain-containing protein n=1 Tax=Austropuccinia psidii MF-1 TaxID=1389203 RepID=A0A9Q3GYS8_9BASI|nr:hypothetical protein [Austropuccinia psidii MF-1]